MRRLSRPPTNVKVSVVGYVVHIEWEAPDEDSEAVTGYEIVRRMPHMARTEG